MRVRPQRTSFIRRPDRSAHPVPRVTPPKPPPSPEVAHPHQHRARQSGGPEDTASYNCGCGMTFMAAVSTSVACPHCGAGQAW